MGAMASRGRASSPSANSATRAWRRAAVTRSLAPSRTAASSVATIFALPWKSTCTPPFDPGRQGNGRFVRRMFRGKRSQAGEEAGHRRPEAVEIDQERVMALRRIGADEARVRAAKGQALGHFLLLLHRE